MKRRPIRVLHCIPHLQSGGADNVVRELVKRMDGDGIVCRVCVLNGEAVLGSQLEGLPKPYLLDFNGSLKSIGGIVSIVQKLRAIADEFCPDIVHSHLWPACRLVAIALIGKPAMHVWHIHDTREWLLQRDLRSWIFRWWTYLVLKWQRPVVLSVSQSALKYTIDGLGCRIPNCHIVYNGVERKFLEYVKPFPRRDGRRSFVIGSTSLFRPEKGHRYLLKAVKKLLDAGYDVSVKLAGSGQTFEEIQSLTKELCISERFEFPGYVRDIPAFLAGLDAFILPSIAYEGLSLALLEAMALQIPVIATPIAGTSEVIVNGYNGLLVPPADSEMLAKAIEDLIRNPALAERMGIQGKESIMARYTYDILADKVADIYKTMCEME